MAEISGPHAPRFSVVMPLYNHAPYVGAAIESVLAQSFGDFELVVCNDGSTDGSLEVVRGYVDARIRIVDKPNGGTVSALNACLLHSAGRYVCWLSSDDLYAPGKLHAHHEFHTARPESPLSVAPFGYLREGTFSAATQFYAPEGARLLQFVHGNYINGLSVCAEKRLYSRHGLFDPRYRYAHDVERWFRFFDHEVPGYIGGEPLSYSRLDSSVTADADLLGMLDVLKMLCNALHARGLRAFLPAEAEGIAMTPELLTGLCKGVLHPGSLFARFDLRRHVVEHVAHFVAAEGLESMLPAVMSAMQQRGDDESRWMLAQLDQVATLLHQGETAVRLSFVEQLAGLKADCSSDSQRAVLDRYLRQGF